jgi:hypothetical protein
MVVATHEHLTSKYIRYIRAVQDILNKRSRLASSMTSARNPGGTSLGLAESSVALELVMKIRATLRPRSYLRIFARLVVRYRSVFRNTLRLVYLVYYDRANF